MRNHLTAFPDCGNAVNEFGESSVKIVRCAVPALLAAVLLGSCAGEQGLNAL